MAMATKPQNDTSLTLLERIQKFPADLEAWDEFVRRYRPMIHTWCLKWGLQSSDADDVAQDVLVNLLTAMRTFRYDPDRSFHAWLRTVTQHTLGHFSAGRRREPGQLGPEIRIAELVDARVDFEQGLERLFDLDLFAIAMRRIQRRVKPVTWDAFQLTAREGLTGQAAARRLRIPVAHVFVARNRVQKLLREVIRIMKEGGPETRRQGAREVDDRVAGQRPLSGRPCRRRSMHGPMAFAWPQSGPRRVLGCPETLVALA
jgi:RNA polymerase sigma-70 factor (ECF subfamily)